MLHKAWNSKEEMPYCFPRSSIKFQGHTGQNITDFDPNWAFSDYRPVAAFKSLRFALFRVIHQISSHTGWKIDDLNPIWVRLLGRSQLSNPSDLPCSRWPITWLLLNGHRKDIRLALLYQIIQGKITAEADNILLKPDSSSRKNIILHIDIDTYDHILNNTGTHSSFPP